MPERPTVHAPLCLASGAAIEKRRRLKCDRDVKLHLPEALYDDLARQARAAFADVLTVQTSQAIQQQQIYS